MPIMRWDAFNVAHHRPFMIFADVERGQVGHARFEMLRRPIVAMNLKGNFVLLPEHGFIRIGSELDQGITTLRRGKSWKRMKTGAAIWGLL